MLEWSHGRQLDSYGERFKYSYNANGMRTAKSVDGVATHFYMDDTRIIHSQSALDSLYFHYGSDGITGVRHNGTEYIYRKNSLGDITHIFDTDGTLHAKYLYDSWGNYTITDSHGIDITSDMEYTTHIGNINPFRYRGYYYDVESGLY